MVNPKLNDLDNLFSSNVHRHAVHDPGKPGWGLLLEQQRLSDIKIVLSLQTVELMRVVT